MSGTTRAIAFLGGIALAIAAVLVVAPGLVPVPRSRLVAVMEGLTDSVGIGGLALLAGAIATIQGLWSSKTPGAPPAMPVETHDPDRDGPVVGREFDGRLSAARRVGGRTTQAEAMVTEDLRRLATDVYQQVHRCDWATAARAVEEGHWTDDVGAAAFLGGPDAPDVPLRLWFRDIISDEGAFYRQATRTIRAIYALQAGERDVTVESLDDRGLGLLDQDDEDDGVDVGVPTEGQP